MFRRSMLAACAALIAGCISALAVTFTMDNIVVPGVCTITGTTPQTCNAMSGVVTTGTLTTAAATNAAFTINNSSVVAASRVHCTNLGYSGTLVTNGYPLFLTCVPGAGTITVNITNTHAANALNGTVAIGFTVIN